MSKVVLHNHQALGDTVVMTCLVRDLVNAISTWERALAHDRTEDLMKQLIIERMARFRTIFGEPLEVGVNTNFPLVWDHNPHITKYDAADMLLKIGTGYGTQHSNTSGNHICRTYRESLEQKLGVVIPQGRIKPDLHLSAEEKEDREIDRRYWLITTGGRPQFTSKLWPYDRWQQVVDALPHIVFVQVGLAKHYHPRLKGPNVIDLVGETEHPDWGVRRLFKLAYHADGAISLISALMHIMGAFEKACVVIAGGREPTSYEAYNWHQYLHNQGCMSCLKADDDPNKKLKSYVSATNACWRTSIGGCPTRVEIEFEGGIHEFARCVTMITVEDVVRGMLRYYEGGILPSIENNISAPAPRVIDLPPIKKVSHAEKVLMPELTAHTRPIFKLVCNASSWGGGERSPAYILKAMAEKGWRAQLVPKVPSKVNGEFLKALEGTGVEISNKITEPCEVMLMYSNDMVFSFDKPRYQIFEKVQAKRKIMVLNYAVGKAPDHPLFSNWDLYGFLSSELEEGFLNKLPDADTFVLPPPVDIQPFLDASPGNLNKTLHLVRVSTQPEKKYPKNIGEMMEAVRFNHLRVRFSFMAAPVWVPDGNSVYKFRQGEMPVLEFLARGNCFWYPLPKGYTDQGPRVIVEALAFGLPVIADNRSGAKDRITDDIGWKCDSHEDYATVIQNIDGKALVEKGKAAKEHARKHFDPTLWVEKIIGK